MKPPPTIPEVLRELELPPDFLAPIGRCVNDAERRDALAKIHYQAKRHFKELAKKHHPDRGGSLEKMQTVSAAFDVFKTLQLRPRPMPVRVFSMGMTIGGDYGTTTTDSSGSITWTIRHD